MREENQTAVDLLVCEGCSNSPLAPGEQTSREIRCKTG